MIHLGDMHAILTLTVGTICNILLSNINANDPLIDLYLYLKINKYRNRINMVSYQNRFVLVKT